MTTIQLNGSERQVADGQSVADLLEALGVRHPFTIVERNGAVLRKEDFSSTALVTGDRIEIIALMGGG